MNTNERLLRTVAVLRAVVARGALILALFVFANSIHAEDYVPPDSGVVDVTKPPYNADKTGATDCTSKIQQAIYDSVDAGKEPIRKRNHIIYFPNGTYLVSNRLEWRDSAGRWHAWLAFLGESRDRTVIKLKNGVFTDPASPKA